MVKINLIPAILRSWFFKTAHYPSDPYIQRLIQTTDPNYPIRCRIHCRCGFGAMFLLATKLPTLLSMVLAMFLLLKVLESPSVISLWFIRCFSYEMLTPNWSLCTTSTRALGRDISSYSRERRNSIKIQCEALSTSPTEACWTVNRTL